MKMSDHAVLRLIERTLTLMAGDPAAVAAVAVAPVPEIQFLQEWEMTFENMNPKEIIKAAEVNIINHATMALFQISDGYVLKHSHRGGNKADPTKYRFMAGVFATKPAFLIASVSLHCKVSDINSTNFTRRGQTCFKCTIDKQRLSFIPNLPPLINK
jgi:hypothetical protein